MKLGILSSSLSFSFLAASSFVLLTGCGALSSIQNAKDGALAKANEAQAMAADPSAALQAKANEQLANAKPKALDDAQSLAADPKGAARAKALPESTPTTVEIKNECTKTVPVFYGEKPKFGSGTNSTLGGNSINSIGRGADGTLTVWLTDKSEKGIAKAAVTKTTKRVVVEASCTKIHAE